MQLCMILYCVSKPYTQLIAGTRANSTAISTCDFTYCSLTRRHDNIDDGGGGGSLSPIILIITVRSSS